MDNIDQINCDVLVIGRGFAGMTAAARSGALGLKTVQVGSASSFFLHPGLIDLLGVYPIEKKEVLNEPDKGLAQLKRDLPGHPYSHMNYTRILESIAFVSGFLKESGLSYQRDTHHNQSVLTSAGTFKPSFLVPRSMTGSNPETLKDKQILFVGFNGLKGFSAQQLSAMVEPLCQKSMAVTIDVPGHSGELPPVQIAEFFETEPFMRDLVAGIKSQCPDHIDMIGLPAVCGVKNHDIVFSQLEEQLGCSCFEIPGLPPSIPGLRLRNAFDKGLSNHHVRVMNNTRVTFAAHDGQFFNMTAYNQNIQTRIQAKGIVLASGRFQGDGLIAERKMIKETVFGLPVRQPVQRNQWYHLDFFNPGGHAINTAGIETNDTFQPLDTKGEPAFEHLYAAGSILANNDWMRLKSGGGVSCASAVTAVNHLYEAIKGKQHG